jgi:hypothetical protein
MSSLSANTECRPYRDPLAAKRLPCRTRTNRARRWAYATTVPLLLAPSSSRDTIQAQTFRPPLAESIDRAVWAIVRTARVVRFTAPNGTDITFTLDDRHWQQMRGDRETYSPIRGEAFRPNHFKMNPALSRRPDASGTVVTDRTDLQPPEIPEMRWTVRNGRIVEITGGGNVGDKLRELSTKYAETKFDLYPAPGFSWLTELTLATDPGETPGLVHVSIGEDLTRAGHITDPTYRDLDYYIPDGTLTINGEVVVKDGRLLLLDRPEFREELRQQPIGRDHGAP